MHKRIESYILRSFLSLFWSLFFTLFSISSLILIIRLADLTGVINIDFVDFITLYIFGVPQLIFYTLPASFFLSAGIAFAKLSFDRELVAVFAIGATLKNVLMPIVKIALLFSMTLLFLGYFLNPYATSVAKNFIENKKATSKLNIKASEAGQKFGDWLVFVSDESDGAFKDMVLFSTSSKASLIDANAKEDNSTTFVSASSAKLASEKGVPTLILDNGRGYKIQDNNSAKILDFKQMKIRSKPPKGDFELGSFVDYWMQGLEDKKRAKDFSDVFLTALFPLISIFFIPALGIVNPRYQKNRAPLYFILVITAFYVSMLALNPILTYVGILVLAPLWVLGGYVFYKKSAAVRF